MYTGDPNFMTSFARGLTVMAAFTSQTPRMSIPRLSLRTGLSRAAVRRCLYTLVKLGFAYADSEHRYSLRPGTLALTNACTVSNMRASSMQVVSEHKAVGPQQLVK